MALAPQTDELSCAATNSATRVTSEPIYPRAMVISSPFTNSGTIYIADVDAGLQDGIALKPGDSFTLGPVPGMSENWDDIAASAWYIRADQGATDKVQVTRYKPPTV